MNLYMLYVSPKGGGRTDETYFLKLFFHSFTFILIIVPLYGRKFCDGHIILVVFVVVCSFDWEIEKESDRERGKDSIVFLNRNSSFTIPYQPES